MRERWEKVYINESKHKWAKQSEFIEFQHCYYLDKLYKVIYHLQSGGVYLNSFSGIDLILKVYCEDSVV